MLELFFYIFKPILNQHFHIWCWLLAFSFYGCHSSPFTASLQPKLHFSWTSPITVIWLLFFCVPYLCSVVLPFMKCWLCVFQCQALVPVFWYFRFLIFIYCPSSCTILLTLSFILPQIYLFAHHSTPALPNSDSWFEFLTRLFNILYS